MLYLIALTFPPLACLCSGKFIHFLINVMLCLSVIGIPFAYIHAWLIVKGSYRESNKQIVIYRG